MFATATARMSERTCDREFRECERKTQEDCLSFKTRDDYEKCVCSKYDLLKEWYLFNYVTE